MAKVNATFLLMAAALVAGCDLDPLRSSDLHTPRPVDGGAPTASLAGIVRDAKSGAALAGATVLAAGVSTTTDATGTYLLEGLPLGAVKGSAAHAGYQSASFDLVLAEGANVHDVTLVPIPCEQTGCGPDEFCNSSTGKCEARAGVAELSGAVYDVCDGRALRARITIAGKSTCSTAGGKGYFMLAGLPAGGPQALTAARPGYLPYSKPETLMGGPNYDTPAFLYRR